MHTRTRGIETRPEACLYPNVFKVACETCESCETRETERSVRRGKFAIHRSIRGEEKREREREREREMDSSLIAGSTMLWQKINDCVTRRW